MTTIGTLLTILIHVAAIIDAYPNLKKTQGWLRMLLAIFPPLLGPLVYFLTRASYLRTVNRKRFMEGKQQFS